MKPLITPLLLAVSMASGIAAPATPPPVESKFWLQFKNATDRSLPDILPDFSYAGYENSEKPIPDVAGPVFKVTDFGAIPDDLISDEQAIRDAVAAAEKAGGGVILFPAGKFLVWADRQKPEPIRILSSNIVIRGAGSSKGGTVIRSIHSGYHSGNYKVPKDTGDFLTIPYIFIFQEKSQFDRIPTAPGQAPKAAASKKLVKITGPLKRSTFEIPIESAEGWKPGYWLAVKAKSKLFNEELMAGLEPDPSWLRILEGLSISELHRVKEVSGNTLILREPLLVNVGEDFGAKVAPVDMLSQVGVEDIAFQGAWRAEFVHHRSALDDEGWDAVLFDGVANGWVRRCAFLNMNTGVYVKNSTTCSIIQNRFAGTMAHYDAAIRSDASFNLLGLIRDLAGHRHGVSTGNRSAGTTIWRCQLKENQSVDSHGNGPYATLIDRVDGGSFTNSGGPGSSFPNHLRWMIFWNYSYNGTDKEPIDFWEYSKNGIAKFVRPLFVGLHGKTVSLKEESLLSNESQGQPVSPDSLYEAQLALRLGSLPEWIDSMRSQWKTLAAEDLPFLGTPTRSEDLYEETFPLATLLEDLTVLLGQQELGWGLPVEIENTEANSTLTRDYVLLRTILQQMATYATPLPKKESGKSTFAQLQPLQMSVSATQKEISIEMPVTASVSDQKKNADSLKCAQELAPACQARVEATPKALCLVIQR
ncbi:MAG: DUF4955 domain-containing protein [Proteobacteria bacterium]|nr:DUF4955 domain-containing protein [Pseudomonadota bacterium]